MNISLRTLLRALALAAVAVVLSAVPAMGRELTREQLGLPTVAIMARTWGPLAPLATYSSVLAQASDQELQAAWVAQGASDTVVEGKVAALRINGIWGVQRYLIALKPDGSLAMTYSYGVGAAGEAWRKGEVSIAPRTFTLTAGRERIHCTTFDADASSLECDIALRQPDGDWRLNVHNSFQPAEGPTAGAHQAIRKKILAGRLYPVRAEATDRETLDAFVPAEPGRLFYSDKQIGMIGFPQANGGGGRFSVAYLPPDDSGVQLLAFRPIDGALRAEGNIGTGEKSVRGPVAKLEVGRGGEILITDRAGATKGYRLSADRTRLLVRALRYSPTQGWTETLYNDYVQGDLPGSELASANSWGAIAGMRGKLWKTPYGYEYYFATRGQLAIERFAAPGRRSPVVCSGKPADAGRIDFFCWGDGNPVMPAIGGLTPEGFVREGVRYTRKIEDGLAVFLGSPGNLRIEEVAPVAALRDMAEARERRRVGVLVDAREKKEAEEAEAKRAHRAELAAIEADRRRRQRLADAAWAEANPTPPMQPLQNPLFPQGNPAFASSSCLPPPSAIGVTVLWSAGCMPTTEQILREAYDEGAVKGAREGQEIVARALDAQAAQRQAARRSPYIDQTLPEPFPIPTTPETRAKDNVTTYFWCEATNHDDFLVSWVSRVFKRTGFFNAAIDDRDPASAFNRELSRAGRNELSSCLGPFDSYDDAANNRATRMNKMRGDDWIVHPMY